VATLLLQAMLGAEELNRVSKLALVVRMPTCEGEGLALACVLGQGFSMGYVSTLGFQAPGFLGPGTEIAIPQLFVTSTFSVIILTTKDGTSSPALRPPIEHLPSRHRSAGTFRY
jgi:hypothetical protein